MILRVLILVALLMPVTGCESPKKKKDKKTPPANEKQDQSNDVGFQSFIGRLNKAVAAHDSSTLATMMTPNFGYRLEPPGEGDGVFQYWDQNNLWPTLLSTINQQFAPKGNFMVAPSQFAFDPQFSGYRAGITRLNGSWRFAYFVKD